MCGIVGKLYIDQERAISRRELELMARTLIHRGPDGEGVWCSGNIGFAHRRLAIIDLRPDAGQPMSNEDGAIWITFNGEIYNFQELRKELESRGHVFRTQSDTEAIIHAYEEYGRRCLDRLRGMFAFAIWDSRTRTLFLARDRLGKKPLYYFADSERFLFASEIKALLTDEAVPREPDPAAIDHFLTLQYIPSPLSAFRGIQKLPPAHWLEVREGCAQIGRYWQLRYSPKRKISMPDAIAELRWRLAEAVRVRLVSDVPLGAFLSGGVDSSAVVAAMAGEMDQPVRTFSVGFAEASFDERPFARQVAERYGTTHTELVVDTQIKDLLPRLAWHYDEPLGDASAVPSYAIAEVTRQHVTVVLNGDGGDENFAGYDWYMMDRLAHRGEVIPLALRKSFHALMRGMPEWWRRYAPVRKATRLAEVLALPPAYRYAQWSSQFGPGLRCNLYSTDFKAIVGGSCPETSFEHVFSQSDAEDWTDTVLGADVQLYLPDDLLVKMDRATMAHSLEARSPFLDHEFMEFVASLPAAFKLLGTRKKYILKAALRGVLPDTVLDRPKMGFSAPVAYWLRNDLREMIYDVLLSSRALQRGYFEPQVISTLLEEHCIEGIDHAARLWDLLMLELWHREFIDRAALGEANTISSVERKTAVAAS